MAFFSFSHLAASAQKAASVLLKHVLGIAWLLISSHSAIAQTPVPSAEEGVPPKDATMEQRSWKSRQAITLPEQDRNPSAIGQQGVYFGVGFRQVGLLLRDDNYIASNNAATNGIGFNLGYLGKDRGLEYTRHTSLIDLSKPQGEGEDQFDLVQVISNNFSVFLATQIFPDVRLHYGVGLQLAEIQVSLQERADEAETREASTENSILINMGFSYFITHNFFLQYRYSLANYSPLFTGSGVNNLMHRLQMHAVFVEYYFRL